jgi:DNA-binding MarR family transcriptional regulator
MHPSHGSTPPCDLPGTDPDVAEAWRAFLRTLHAHRRLMARAVSENVVPPAQYGALREIGHHDGITQRDLAEQIGISRPTLTVMLQKMEKAGLVARNADEADQRYTHLHLTPEGARAHEGMHDAMRRLISQVISPLSQKDRSEFVRLLNLIQANMTALVDADPLPRREDAK